MNTKLIMASSLVLVICGCSSRMDVRYQDTIDGGCEYSEIYRSRKSLFQFFGTSDADLTIRYAGVSCKKIIETELKDETHKKPYNSVPVVKEVPPLKVQTVNN